MCILYPFVKLLHCVTIDLLLYVLFHKTFLYNFSHICAFCLFVKILFCFTSGFLLVFDFVEELVWLSTIGWVIQLHFVAVECGHVTVACIDVRGNWGVSLFLFPTRRSSGGTGSMTGRQYCSRRVWWVIFCFPSEWIRVRYEADSLDSPYLMEHLWKVPLSPIKRYEFHLF